MVFRLFGVRKAAAALANAAQVFVGSALGMLLQAAERVKAPVASVMATPVTVYETLLRCSLSQGILAALSLQTIPYRRYSQQLCWLSLALKDISLAFCNLTD